MDKPVLPAHIVDYLARVEPARNPVLAAMEREARARRFPIIGPTTGRFLAVLARAAQARRVFEMGSGYGYSTLWFAEAVGAGGEVVHTDGDPQNTAAARAYLERAGLADRVRFLSGDARDLLRAEPGPFDVVFCDIDKEQYPDVPALAHPRLAPGGLLVFDNLFWYGRMIEPADDDAETRGVIETTRILFEDARWSTSLVPLRAEDGVSISVKL